MKGKNLNPKFFCPKDINVRKRLKKFLESKDFIESDLLHEAELIWVKNKHEKLIDYQKIEERHQFINHFQNSRQLLRSKLGLLKLSRTSNELLAFTPESYCLEFSEDRLKLLDQLKLENNFHSSWILKPNDSYGGKGIEVIFDSSQLKEKINDQSRYSKHIVQRYIKNPLLFKGRKFNIRSYFLILKLEKPCLVFFHEGFCRSSRYPYFLKNWNTIPMHITNTWMQWESEPSKKELDEVIFSFDTLDHFLVVEKKAPLDWVKNELISKIEEISEALFKSVQELLLPRNGAFELFGLDLLVDENLKIWLLECNGNPLLSFKSSVESSLSSKILHEILRMIIEINEKETKQDFSLPLHSQVNFKAIKEF